MRAALIFTTPLFLSPAPLCPQVWRSCLAILNVHDAGELGLTFCLPCDQMGQSVEVPLGGEGLCWGGGGGAAARGLGDAAAGVGCWHQARRIGLSMQADTLRVQSAPSVQPANPIARQPLRFRQP